MTLALEPERIWKKLNKLQASSKREVFDYIEFRQNLKGFPKTREEAIECIAKIDKDELHDILRFIEFVDQKHRYERKLNSKGFKFDWAGDLAEHKHEFGSVELQHKASEWR